jgi:hypothetical protein
MLKNFQTGRRISVENVEKKNLSPLVYLPLITVFVSLFYVPVYLVLSVITVGFYTNVIKVKYTDLIYSCFEF